VIEIILVKYNAPQFENACVASVMGQTFSPYHLTVWDNYPKNENLGKLWNKLIKKSEAEYLCLLNTDTLVEPGWESKLIEVFKMYNDAGVVGPTTCPQGSKNAQGKESKSDHMEIVDFGALYPGWCLSGFCIFFPKKIWEEVGGFPEDFGFYGQEVAFIDRVTEKGYKQYWRKDAYVWHYGGASIKKAEKAGEIDEQAERKIAREKFGKLREEYIGGK